MSDLVLLEPAADGVVRLTLNRPHALNALDRELTALGDPVSALQRVDTSKREAVMGAAGGLRDRIERMRPLFESHEAELPREFREGWAKLTSWVWHIDKRPR